MRNQARFFESNLFMMQLCLVCMQTHLVSLHALSVTQGCITKMFMQDGHAADACLRSFNPKLVGQGAVVNKGDIYLKGLQLRPRQRTVPQGSPAQSCQQSIA